MFVKWTLALVESNALIIVVSNESGSTRTRFTKNAKRRANSFWIITSVVASVQAIVNNFILAAGYCGNQDKKQNKIENRLTYCSATMQFELDVKKKYLNNYFTKTLLI